MEYKIYKDGFFKSSANIITHESQTGHFFNCKKIGYWNGPFFINLSSMSKSHYKNGARIGCSFYDNEINKFQYFYNKPSKKFGEQITWK